MNDPHRSHTVARGDQRVGISASYSTVWFLLLRAEANPTDCLITSFCYFGFASPDFFEVFLRANYLVSIVILYYIDSLFLIWLDWLDRLLLIDFVRVVIAPNSNSLYHVLGFFKKLDLIQIKSCIRGCCFGAFSVRTLLVFNSLWLLGWWRTLCFQVKIWSEILVCIVDVSNSQSNSTHLEHWVLF